MSFATLKFKFFALPEPIRIGIVLGIGFAFMLVLVTLVMILGFRYMDRVQAELEKISNINNVKTELAHTMKYAQRDRSMSLFAISSIEDEFDKDDELRRFDKKGAEWWSAWQKFQAMGMNQQEIELANRINSMAADRNENMRVAIDMATHKHGLEVFEHMRLVAIPGQQLLTDEIDKLLRLQQEQTARAALVATESYVKTRKLLVVLCVLTILTGGIVSVLLLRRVMKQSKQLEQKALFDDLTGLPNRSLFFDRLHQAVSIYGISKKSFSIVVIDLDRFKEVNDREGHHVGDLLLKYVANKLSAVVRRTDIVARMGGDEFMMLLPSVSAESAENIVKKFHQDLCQQVNLENSIVEVACSMGIATYPEHDKDLKQLLFKADMAMYAAKRANVGCRLYSAEIENESNKSIEMESALRYAIDHDQLVLHYQPKISHHTDTLMGVEALVRWEHPERGMIPPDEFITLAESTGLIQPLTFCVLNMALEQCFKWRQQGHEFSVSINLSTHNLLDGDLHNRVAMLLVKYQVKPEWLVFEITESAVMAEPIRALETLVKFDHMGIKLSLDDFGTGYSSLAYIKKLPVSEIKIDKSFIRDMELDSNDTVIVRSTISLGQNLGIAVVAEGVENARIWDLLTELGCDVSQGYYMCRPLSVDALDEWLKSSEWAKPKTKISKYSRDDRRKTEGNEVL